MGAQIPPCFGEQWVEAEPGGTSRPAGRECRVAAGSPKVQNASRASPWGCTPGMPGAVGWGGHGDGAVGTGIMGMEMWGLAPCGWGLWGWGQGCEVGDMATMGMWGWRCGDGAVGTGVAGMGLWGLAPCG